VARQVKDLGTDVIKLYAYQQMRYDKVGGAGQDMNFSTSKMQR